MVRFIDEKNEQISRAQQLVLEAYFSSLSGERSYTLEESKKLIKSLIDNE